MLVLGAPALFEPWQAGRSVGYWVDRACHYDSQESQEARRQLKSLGPGAVPYLVRKLDAHYGWREKWPSWLAKCPSSWQPALHRIDVRSPDEIHYGALETLQLLGPDAKSAVPSLTRLSAARNQQAIRALAAIGPGAGDALPVLHALLTNHSPSLRLDVAGALWEIDRETNLVVQVCSNVVARGMTDGDVMNAAGLLADVGPAAAAAAPALLGVMQSSKWTLSTRGNAAIALGNARVSGPEITAALLAGVDDTNASGPNRLDFRANCALALWCLDSNYAPVGTRLALQALEAAAAVSRGSPQPERASLTNWLAYRRLDPRESLPALKDMLTNESPEMRLAAAQTLADITNWIATIKP
jgi:hypothetical protein